MICSGIDATTGAAVDVSFDGAIASVAPSAARPDVWMAPGFIDAQVNGYAGVDYNTPNSPHEEIGRSIHVLYGTGVTRFYPTVITNAPEEMTGALANLARFKEAAREGAAIEGFHVEGPHISPEDGPRGAHPRHWVRKPDIDEFRRWQDAARGHIRIVTFSPEWPDAPAYVEHIVREGVVASIGHTNAAAAQIADAVAAGATMSTHLGNGAHPMIPRHPNYIIDQMAEDRLTASLIVDGVHLPPAFVKVALRAKGLDRSVLVTDAAMPTGCPPGRYMVGEVEVELTPDSRIVIAGTDRLSASALSIDRAIGNLMRFADLTLGEAVRLATVNAARTAHVPGRTQGLAAGDKADFVLFGFDQVSKTIEVRATYLDGQKVYGS